MLWFCCPQFLCFLYFRLIQPSVLAMFSLDLRLRFTAARLFDGANIKPIWLYVNMGSSIQPAGATNRCVELLGNTARSSLSCLYVQLPTPFELFQPSPAVLLMFLLRLQSFESGVFLTQKQVTPVPLLKSSRRPTILMASAVTLMGYRGACYFKIRKYRFTKH